MADEPEGMGEERQGSRTQQREARRIKTYSLFLEKLREASSLPGERAEKALILVLCALEQQLVNGEVDDLRAQLPVKLQEALQGCRPRPERTPWTSGMDDFLQKVAEDIGGDKAMAESVTRAVLATVRAHMTEGEAERLGNELPEELRVRWARPI